MKKKIIHRDVLERYCSFAGENVILVKKAEKVECLCPELCRGRVIDCKYVRIHNEQNKEPTR